LALIVTFFLFSHASVSLQDFYNQLGSYSKDESLLHRRAGSSILMFSNCPPLEDAEGNNLPMQIVLASLVNERALHYGGKQKKAESGAVILVLPSCVSSGGGCFGCTGGGGGGYALLIPPKRFSGCGEHGGNGRGDSCHG
jgi:hypothetical protein